MPSSLRNEVSSTFTPTPASPIVRSSSLSPPAKKQKMSLTQTYYLAHTARGKLSKEAARGDHNLRLLVGHANLLDGLMLDLAHAEQEQESWFNQTVTNNTKAASEPKHISWADTIPEDVEEAVEEEFYAEDSDSDSDADDEEIDIAQPVPVRKTPQPQTTVTTSEVDEDEQMEDEDFEEDLALTRTSSAHPPELLHEDSDSESEDDSMPPSPPTAEAPLDAFTEKQREAIATTSFYPTISVKSDLPSQIPETEQASFFDEGYYLPQRPTAIATF
ncbi:hypothetical protein ACLMJK_004454 [Lecanora helva]